MAEFARTVFDYNARFKLNDKTTDPNKYALIDLQAVADTVAHNVEEDRPTDIGIVDYGIKLGRGNFVIPVLIYAVDLPTMHQLIQDFKSAFNPDLCELDTTVDNGFHPLKWTENVGGTSRDFQVYLKAKETPQVQLEDIAGLIRPARIQLKAEDPRKYLQAQSQRTGAGTATNAGTFPTPVEITVAASGATSTSLEIKNNTTGKSIYVVEALSNGQTLVIDTRKHSAKLNGTEDRSKIGNNSVWWELNPGSNSIVINNGTNTTITIKWRSAWPL